VRHNTKRYIATKNSTLETVEVERSIIGGYNGVNVKNLNNYTGHIKTKESAMWKEEETTSDGSTGQATACQHDGNGIL
jgi:hypothetical protein